MRPWTWTLALTGVLFCLWVITVSFPVADTGAYFTDTATFTSSGVRSGDFEAIPEACTGNDWKTAKVVRLTSADNPYYAGNGKEIILGTPGDDVIHGGNAKDCILGGAGDDSIEGGNGPDYIDGGQGTDTCNGDRSKDVVLNCEEGTEGDSAKKDAMAKHEDGPGAEKLGGGDDASGVYTPHPAAVASASTPTATPSPTNTPTATPTPKTVNKPGEYKGILKFPSTPTPSAGDK